MICRPPHTRNLVENCPLAVDIDAFVRAGVLDGGDVSGTVTVAENSLAFAVRHQDDDAPLVCFACAVETAEECREVRAAVPVVSTAQRIGSRRWWACPGCGRRARILYSMDFVEVGCRLCLGLWHRSAVDHGGRGRTKPAQRGVGDDVARLRLFRADVRFSRPGQSLCRTEAGSP